MTAEPGVVADGPVCHGLCGAQPAPSRPAAKRYVRQEEMEAISQRWHVASMACAAVACLQSFLVMDRIKHLSSIVWELGFEPGLITVSLSTTVVFFVTSAIFIVLGLLATDKLAGKSLTFRLLSMISVQALVAGVIIWGAMLASPYIDFIKE